MNLNLRHILIAASLLLAQLQPAGAQTLSDGQTAVRNVVLTPLGDRMQLSMDVCLDDLSLTHSQSVVVHPVLTSLDGSRRAAFEPLVVDSRAQHVLYERGIVNATYAGVRHVARRGRGPQTEGYLSAVAWEPWMDAYELRLEEDLCACGDLSALPYVPALIRNLPPNPLDLIDLADAEPSPFKPARNLHGTAFINFVVDRWEMKPDYMDNRRELRKITDTLNIMVADRNITVDRIKIHGWASPESPYEHNRMLATNRAQSLTDYIKTFYQLPDAVFARAEATPENWIGLLEALDTIPDAQLPHKAEFRQTCEKVLADVARGVTSQADRDELALKAKYRTEYDLLLRTVYPHLRRSDYEITFRIREFSLEEACQVYLTHPDQLSLYEFWAVAQTFEHYSDDYNRCMQTAFSYYPDSTVAALNVANAALRKGDRQRAAVLLRKAGDGPEAVQARAVLAILDERYDEAARLLDEAERLGLDVSRNREAIRKLRRTDE